MFAASYSHHWPRLVRLVAISSLILIAQIVGSAQSKRGEIVDHQDAERIERRITVLVGAEGDEIAQTIALPLKVTETPVGSRESNQSTLRKPSGIAPEIVYNIDETTKLIYIDSRNERGLVVGRIGNETTRSRIDQFAEAKPLAGSGGSTNYSVYFVSRSIEHIAVLIDIQEIDFEPIINCEYQDLRFSIVGEITAAALKSNQTEGENSAAGSENDDAKSSSSEADGPLDDQSEEEASAPMPVSEALSFLLNSPLNKTILDDSDEPSEFRLILRLIDHLHEDACQNFAHYKNNDLQNKTESSNREEHRQQPRRKSNQNNSRRKSRRRHRSKTSTKRRQSETCAENDEKFKQVMFNKLSENFEWDSFKIVCGKTKRLIIPMRAFKLSVYSDEFALNSKFALRYQFVSDPNVLPAFDNGKYFCRNRNVIDLALKCDGYDDCGDASDESIKICGYPNGDSSSANTAGKHQTRAHYNQSASSKRSHSSSPSAVDRRKLTYFNGDGLLNCCQSSDWQNAVSQAGQANQAINLHSLIGDSMNLFSGPLFALTKSHANYKQRQKPHRLFKRIVGGAEAHRGSWPGQVSLQYELIEPLCHFCAGTLIHPQYVITAGHCITKDGLSRGIKVVFGAHDLRQVNTATSSQNIQVRYVDDAQIYPGVDVKHLSYEWENDMNNDIALLRLNAPILITPQVAPACLAPFNTPLRVNTTCRSIGWGETHGSGSSNRLKQLSLRVVDSTSCSRELLDKESENKDGKRRSASQEGRFLKGNKARNRQSQRINNYEATSTIDNYSNQTMICVNNDLGHGICQGDSGGPLYCDRQTQSGEHCTEIYGVASFIIQYATVGAMCAVENLPGIFGEVSSKTEWISSTIKMFEQTYRLKYS